MRNRPQLTKTENMELIETHNLTISLKRLAQVSGRGELPMKRALYHAIGMAYALSHNQRAKIREVLELP